MTTLRDYKAESPQYYFYKEQHATQTYDYVMNKLAKYTDSNVTTMSMSRALELMDSFIDPSDPDATNENSIHAYQTAE